MTRSQKIGAFLFKYRSFTPLPLIAVVFIFFPPGTEAEPWPFIIGLLLALAGESIRIHSCGHAAGGTSGRESSFRADDLNTTGFYSICRNPLYLGNLLMMAGILLSYGNPWALLLGVILLAGQYHFIILAEEYYLEDKYGEQFRLFRTTVPRLLPNPLKWQRPSNAFRGPGVIWQEIDTIYNTAVLFLAVLAWKAGQTEAVSQVRFFLFLLAGFTLAYLVLKAVKKFSTKQNGE